jgi:tetratricopeptide (TPR) repeat protein
MIKEYKYKAFISYSHADKKFARRLHKKIENYKIPKSLREKYPDLPKDLKRSIFLDEAELPTSDELSSQLTGALEKSKYLIVVASPSAVGVHKKEGDVNWVEKEIRHFKKVHKNQNVLAIIKEGEPHSHIKNEEAFPQALKYEVDEKGELTKTPTHPIAGDARVDKRKALLKLIAGILKVDFADLEQRDKQEQRKKLAITSVVVAFVIALSIYASQQFASEVVNKELENLKSQKNQIEYTIRHKNLDEKTVINLNKKLKKIKQDIKNKKATLAWFGKNQSTTLKKTQEIYTKEGVDKAIEHLTSQKSKANKEDRLKEISKEDITLARFYIEKYRFKKATKAFESAIDIFFDYGNVLEYANFLNDQYNLKRAVALYTKLQTKNLTKEQKSAVLNNLALLQDKLNQNQAALGNYEEALALYKALAKTNPRAYGIDYARTILIGVLALGESKENLNEAKKILQNFRGVPQAEQFLKMIEIVEQK